MSIIAVTPVEITPGTSGSFVPVDLSGYIPVGATGVVCQCINTSVASGRQIMIQHGDSTDTDASNYNGEVMQWQFCGVNSSREINVKVENTSDCEVWLMGYFGESTTFFVNAVDKTPGTTGSYQDVDISTDTGADTALAALIYFDSPTSTVVSWARKNGSTDDYKESWKGVTHQVVGCDGSEIFESYASSSAVAVMLVGYVVDKVVYHDAAEDRSLGSTGSYADLAALGAGAVFGMYHIVTNDNNGLAFALRQNGSAFDKYYDAEEKSFALVACDGSGLVEGKIESTNVDFYELGYFTSGSLIAAGDEMRYGFSGASNTGFGQAGFA